MMRVLVAAGLAGACQNGYPLEPTPCDDFCLATQRESCDDNDPAWCVANCEENHIVQLDEPGCRELWDAALECAAAMPDDEICWGGFDFSRGPNTPCGAEAVAYSSACLPGYSDYY
jgi:hypothetical protein